MTPPRSLGEDDLGKLDSSLIESTYGHDLAEIALNPTATPFRHFMRGTANSIFETASREVAKLSRPPLVIRGACDVKGGSAGAALERVQRSGFLAVCGNSLEREIASRWGFSGSDIVLSGPAKFWPEGFCREKVHCLFCDSLDEFQRLIGHIDRGEEAAEYLGATVRLAEFPSRFGIPVSMPGGLNGLCNAFARLSRPQKLGLRFHVPSREVGMERWSQIAQRFLELAGFIQSRIGRPIGCVSLGGDWFSEDWIFALQGPLAEVTRQAAELLPEMSCLVLEAGTALEEPSVSLIARVLEVRRSPLAEVIADASVVELPGADRIPHRVAWRPAADLTWRSLEPGQDPILGRLNLEADVLTRRIRVPRELQAGDLLAFCDAGAYGLSPPFPQSSGE